MELTKAATGLIVLMLLVVGSALLARQYLAPKKAVQVAEKAPVRKPVAAPVKKIKEPEPRVKTKAAAKPPQFEVIPKQEVPPPEPPAKPKPPLANKLPKVAIIIDDIGYDRAMADRFIRLDTGLTLSVLPFSPFQKTIAGAANARGLDVMLHLPMEPMEYPRIDPGPGALLTSMSPDSLIHQLNENLNRVPFIKGVNNHMGSRMTAESNQMNQVFSVLKERHLFFIDSRTTAATLSKQSARLFKVPFAQRDVFLDHVQDPAHVREQIARLVKYAEAHGEAIGIGHPYNVTYEILRGLLPDMKKKVNLVPASHLVRVSG